jgi:4a-hydroxytetrahydrobiopterin dehydratase
MTDGRLSPEDVEAANLSDWRVIGEALHTRYRTGNFATGLKLVNAIGEAAEQANHHPDLDLRYPHVDIDLSSHDAGGITDRDISLARRISELAADLGVDADPSGR